MSTLPPSPPEYVPEPSGPPAEQAPEAAGRPPWRTWVIAAVVTAVVTGGAVFALTRPGDSATANANTAAASANASANGTGNGPGVGARGRFAGTRGEVTKIDGSDITVEATDQNGESSSVVVRTSDDTTFTKTVTGNVSDIKTGDNVIVIGDSSSGTIAATSITDNGDAEALGGAGNGNGPPQGFQPPDGSDFTPPSGSDVTPPDGRQFPGGQGGPSGGGFNVGQVTAVNGSMLTISTMNGDTVTVTTDDNTTITLTQSATLDDVKVGDSITAMGDNSDGVVTASSVRIGDGRFPGGGLFPGGGFPGGQPPATGDDTGDSSS